MLSKKLKNILQKCSNLLIESNRLGYSLQSNPLQRQRCETSANLFQIDRLVKPCYPQLATLRVRSDGFEVIL